MYDIKIGSFSFLDYPNIAVDSVEGLGSPSSTISTQKMGQDGTKFAGRTRDQRNIVINFSIVNNVKQTRTEMYDLIPTGEEETITVDNKTTTGYIEKFELNNFQQVTTGQISAICPDPYFYGKNNKINLTTNYTTVNSNSNNNDYVIKVTFNSDVQNFTFTFLETAEIKYTVKYNFKNGDILEIDTKNRKILLNNKNIYSAKDWTTWKLLNKGQNKIKTSVSAKIEVKDRYLAI